MEQAFSILMFIFAGAIEIMIFEISEEWCLEHTGKLRKMHVR